MCSISDIPDLIWGLETRLSPLQLVSSWEAQSHYPSTNFASPVQFLQLDLQLIFPLCFPCSSLQRQSSEVCTSLEPDSRNANTTNCHSLIAPALLLQLQRGLFIKQADILYILLVNTEIYMLSAEIRLIFYCLLGFLSCHNSLPADIWIPEQRQPSETSNTHLPFGIEEKYLILSHSGWGELYSL